MKMIVFTAAAGLVIARAPARAAGSRGSNSRRN